jgi:hypothetical protein
MQSEHSTTELQPLYVTYLEPKGLILNHNSLSWVESVGSECGIDRYVKHSVYLRAPQSFASAQGETIVCFTLFAERHVAYALLSWR